MIDSEFALTIATFRRTANQRGRVNVYVYPTDRDWYRFLSAEPDLDEVNFWRPGGRQPFRQLRRGDLFLFRFGKPDNAITGGGTFTHFSFAPISQAWEAFGRKNGSSDYQTFLRLLARHKDLEGPPEQAATAIIGCIVLTAPFFLPHDRWIPIPADYEVTSPQGQRFDASSRTAQLLTAAVMGATRAPGAFRIKETVAAGEVHFGESVVRRRLGQGGFSLLIADAYEKRCAISGERTYPVLEAAHIVPVSRGGMHRPDNGLLLRSDIHKLFDRGYVSVRPDGEFVVSPALKDDWHNGRIYYDLGGRRIRQPSHEEFRPAREFLEWHNDTVFKR